MARMKRALRKLLEAGRLWNACLGLKSDVERAFRIVYDPATYWNSHADKYVQERLGKTRDFEETERNFIVTQIKAMAPHSVLEVGCAFGRNLKGLLSDDTEIEFVVGLDLSRKMLLHARAHLPCSKSVSLVLGNALTLPFRDSSFDVACTFGLLMHVPPKAIDRAVSELSRVSRNGIVNLELRLPYEPATSGKDYHQFSRAAFAYDYRALYKRAGQTVSLIELMGTRIGLVVRKPPDQVRGAYRVPN